MNIQNRDITFFLSFCTEQYKNAKGISGEQALLELERYGVLQYLQEHFEILHTQGAQWILEDIDTFIQIRKDKAQ